MQLKSANRLRAKDFTKLCINNLFNQQLITIIMNKSELIDISLQMQELQKQLLN
jgi:hypothetical protein